MLTKWGSFQQLSKKLLKGGIDSIEVLTSYTFSDFCRIQGIGEKTANSIRSILKKNSLDFSVHQSASRPVFNPMEVEDIIDWLSHTSEELICAMMVFEQVLHRRGKPSRTESNELVRIIREHNDWVDHRNKNGKARCGKYGPQRCFVRIKKRGSETD